MTSKKRTEKSGSTKSPAKRKPAAVRPSCREAALDNLWAAHVFQGGDGTEPGGNLIPLDREAGEWGVPWPVVMTENLWFQVIAGPLHPEISREIMKADRDGTLSESRALICHEKRRQLMTETLGRAGRKPKPRVREWAFSYSTWGGYLVAVKAVLTKPGEIGGERLVLMANGES